MQHHQNAALLAQVSDDATVSLAAVDEGDRKAPGKLLEPVYEELYRLAALKCLRKLLVRTLQPTTLVHEALLLQVG